MESANGLVKLHSLGNAPTELQSVMDEVRLCLPDPRTGLLLIAVVVFARLLPHTSKKKIFVRGLQASEILEMREALLGLEGCTE